MPLRRVHAPIEDKFAAGLPSPLPLPDDCWNWKGLRSHYGLIAHGYQNHYAHRMAYEKWCGPIPEGLVVRHTCDNRFCVNPSHLILGKQADNVQDAVERGLNCRGERHGRSALTESQVREIKTLLRCTNLSQRQIADRYPVTTSAIEGIASGRTWKWVEEFVPTPDSQRPKTEDLLGVAKDWLGGQTVDDWVAEMRRD